MSELIPVFQDISSKWKNSMVLDDLLINMEIHFNSRSESFYLDLFDVENDFSLIGVKLVPNWLLVRQFRAYMPNLEGDLIVLKTDADVGDRITYDNLGNGYDFFFYDNDEAEDWEDENGVG